MCDQHFEQMFPTGEPNEGFAQYFTGQSYLAPLTDGGTPVSMVPGTSIRVPAGTKHWHGAKADSWFSHLAFITPGEGVSNEWLEPVTDDEYGQLPTDGDNA